MEFEKLISERHSVRSFKNEHLSHDVIKKILDAGHKAPTGCNYQPFRVLVLNSDESMEKLKVCTRCHFNAPAAMIVLSNSGEGWKRPYDGALSAPVDANIVATHLMLAAYNEGIGSCWVMHFRPDELRKEFNIPVSLEPACILVMGKEAEDSEVNKLHYESRPLEELVVYESFQR